MTRPPSRASLAALSLCAIAPAAFAQEAMFTEAATMPSPHTFVLRPQVNYMKFGPEPDASTTQTERIEWSTTLQAGLARDFSIRLDVPLAWDRTTLPSGARNYDHGVEDLDAVLKWRIYKNDTGGIDTFRVALLAGAAFASGDDKDFSTQSINPHIGAVATLIRGRHGFNQDLSFKFNTGGTGIDNLGGGNGPSDALFYNSSYLFRIYPDAYTPDTTGAWYLTAELNGIYETNGDNEIRASPGLMYEGRGFALELMAQLPLLEDLDHRADLRFSVGIGVRFTF